MFFQDNRREAYEVERAQAKQSSVGATLAYMFGLKYVPAPLVKLTIVYFLSILWVAFLLFMAGKSMWLGLLCRSCHSCGNLLPRKPECFHSSGRSLHSVHGRGSCANC